MKTRQINLTDSQELSKIDKLCKKDPRLNDYIMKYDLFTQPDEVSEEAWRQVIRRDMEEFYG